MKKLLKINFAFKFIFYSKMSEVKNNEQNNNEQKNNEQTTPYRRAFTSKEDFMKYYNEHNDLWKCKYKIIFDNIDMLFPAGYLDTISATIWNKKSINRVIRKR